MTSRPLDLPWRPAVAPRAVDPGVPLELGLVLPPDVAPVTQGLLVHIDRVMPEQLMRIELQLDGSPVFNLHAERDARGALLPAGVMLAAITAVSGREGLVIEQRLSGAPPQAILLRLWLARPRDAARVGARVGPWV